jgi:glucokinase
VNSSHFADVHVQQQIAVGFDIGGTKIASGVVSAAGEVVEELPTISTPSDQSEILASLCGIVDQVRQRWPDVAAIGVGAAGLVDWPEGHIRMAPNTAFERMSLRALLEKQTGLPTTVDNDANVAAWAEARLGNSAPYMLFITVGTGVGGGIVLDGSLFRGRSGIGAEIGHIVVDPHGGQVCGCGTVGCLEAMASGRALGRYGRQAAAAEPDGMLVKLAGTAEQVTGETVFQAARSGDATALAQYDRLGEWLGIGLASIVTLLDLELIVVGGGVAAAGDILLGPTRASMTRYVMAPNHRTLPDVIPASHGNIAGWVGAGLLAIDCLTAAGDAEAVLPRQKPEAVTRLG